MLPFSVVFYLTTKTNNRLVIRHLVGILEQDDKQEGCACKSDVGIKNLLLCQTALDKWEGGNSGPQIEI